MADAAAESDRPEEAASAEAAPADAGSTISEEEVSALLDNGSPSKARPYDLSALKINRSQLPMLEVVAKSFAERSGAALSALLGRDAIVQFTALESSKAAELQAALPVPASLLVVRMKPLPGSAFVTVDPALLLNLMDGFFGGSGRVTAGLGAAVSPSAQRFLAMMLRAFAPEWTAAWAPVTPLEIELVKQETNPRLMHVGAAQDVVLALKFNVEFGAHGGRIDLLIPEAMLAPIREALAADGPNAPVRKQENWAPVLSAALLDAQFEMRAILAQAEISLRDLVKLVPGDIIPIDPPEQAGLLVGNVALYRGRFGVSEGRNALTILPGGHP